MFIGENVWRIEKYLFTLYFKVLFMENKNQHLDTLHDIKQMMERSSRFISLSGLSGIAAGICALAGAWYTSTQIQPAQTGDYQGTSRLIYEGDPQLKTTLLEIAIVTFVAAAISSFLFTYLRSKKTHTPIWGATAQRLMFNMSIPLIVGGLVIYRMLEFRFFGMIAPACLLFYGLGLVNASKYTLGEVRYLGYALLVLGIINLWMVGYGLYFWAMGFGVLHIVYGVWMWLKYERTVTSEQ